MIYTYSICIYTYMYVYIYKEKEDRCFFGLTFTVLRIKEWYMLI